MAKTAASDEGCELLLWLPLPTIMGTRAGDVLPLSETFAPQGDEGSLLGLTKGIYQAASVDDAVADDGVSWA